jgi:hypothetical protein
MNAGRLVVAALVMATGAGSAGAASGTGSSDVALAVQGSRAARVTVAPATTLRLLAQTTMPAGDRLVIVALRGSESRERTVASCRLSPCPGTWREKAGATVRFQALLMRRTGGASRVVARSRVVRVTWETPSVPAVAAAGSGHYEGQTSRGEIIRFDVALDGRGVVNLQVSGVDESCDPQASLSGGSIGPLSRVYPVAPDGGFAIVGVGTTRISAPGPGGRFAAGGTAVSSENGADYRFTITGRVAGASAAGSLDEETGFTDRAVSYRCTSGDVTWAATKG